MQMPNSTPLPPKVGHILRLAEIIREVDGNHDKGAAALAEAILSHPAISAALVAEPQRLSDDLILACLIDIADESLIADHPGDIVQSGRQLLALYGNTGAQP